MDWRKLKDAKQQYDYLRAAIRERGMRELLIAPDARTFQANPDFWDGFDETIEMSKEDATKLINSLPLR